MLLEIINLLLNTPFYPYWLNNIKLKDGNDYILDYIFGDVIEVGAGDGSRKGKILLKYKNVKSYISTDFNSWDEQFEKYNKISKKYGEFGELLFGYTKRNKFDSVCNATKLPFKDASFDTHLSFEVIEHIDNIDNYFKEAIRVLRKGGYIIFSSPFLYMMHGGEPDHKMDYCRYLNGFFFDIANKNNLEIITIYSNTGFGTSFAQSFNQYVMRIILESNYVMRALFLIISPFIFFVNNIFGFLIDLKPDKRFATRFHVVFKNT